MGSVRSCPDDDNEYGGRSGGDYFGSLVQSDQGDPFASGINAGNRQLSDDSKPRRRPDTCRASATLERFCRLLRWRNAEGAISPLKPASFDKNRDGL